MGDCDSVLQALNPAKFNFSLSLKQADQTREGIE